MENLSLLEGLQIAIYGFLTVFIMLSALMFIIMGLSKIVAMIENAKKKEQPVEEKPVVEESVRKIDPDKVYVGEVSLIDVDEKTAACIMAIISDETKIPLQNLIFKKIQLIEED